MDEDAAAPPAATARGGTPGTRFAEQPRLPLTLPVKLWHGSDSVTDAPDDPLSRRQWLALVSTASLAAPLQAAGGWPARPPTSPVGQPIAATAGPPSTQAAAPPPRSGDPTTASAAGVYSIRDFGATGDGKTLDTAAVQAAIDACAAGRGGTVVVPAGDFLIGTIRLKSHVTLHLASQGRLLGSALLKDYAEGVDVPANNGALALIYASKADAVAIEGPGTVDGNGAEFLKNRRASGAAGRPHLVIFSDCTNIVLRDVFLTASAFHCVRFLLSRQVRVDGVRIYNRGGANNDGFHFASTQFAHVSNCDVKAGDDACALFGDCQFITVTNCTFSTRWSIFRFGGGDARHIAVTNCVIYETYGCPIKMACRAGSHYEDMIFSNLIFRDVTGPISLGLDPDDMTGAGGGGDLPRARPAAPHDAIIRNILIDNIRGNVVTHLRPYPELPPPETPRPLNGANPGEVRQCIVLNGIHGAMLEDITISNVHLTFDGGGTLEEATREVPQVSGEYFRIGTPPAYGVYARNVRGLTLNNIRLKTAAPDRRPAVVFDHVEDATVTGLAAVSHPEAPVLRAIDTRDVLLTGARVLTPASTFLAVEGAASAGLTIDGGDLSKAASPVSFSAQASKRAVTVRA
jgi:hypothetical protein